MDLKIPRTVFQIKGCNAVQDESLSSTCFSFSFPFEELHGLHHTAVLRSKNTQEEKHPTYKIKRKAGLDTREHCVELPAAGNRTSGQAQGHRSGQLVGRGPVTVTGRMCFEWDARWCPSWQSALTQSSQTGLNMDMKLLS